MLAVVVMVFFFSLSIYYLIKARLQLRQAQRQLNELNRPILVSNNA